MELVPNGVIHSTYQSRDEAPHQGRFSDQIQDIEIYTEYTDGLKDIEKASHLIILYWLDRANRNKLQNRTPFGPEIRGVFTTRSPNRPNPIAFSIAELIRVEGNHIIVRGIEAINGSPLLDIKPYIPDLDCISEAKVRWYKGKERLKDM